MWTLQTTTDVGDKAVTYRLMPGAVKTMGRAPRADFFLDAALVSRLHCRFSVSASDDLEVEDLRSTNGTFVNGRRVKRSGLAEGDLVRVGRVDLKVVRAAP